MGQEYVIHLTSVSRMQVWTFRKCIFSDTCSRYQVWSRKTLEPPRSAKAFWKGGNQRNVANSSGSNLLNMPDSDPKMGVGKTRVMTNSEIMTIFNNEDADKCAPWRQIAVVNAVCYILQEQLSLPSLPLLDL